MAYIPIASQTLGSAASTVTFNSIPTTLNGQNLRDLVLVFNARASTTTFLKYRLNGNSGSNYSIVTMYGPVGSGSATETSFYIGDINATDRTAGTSNIMDYAVTDKHKSQLSRWGVGTTSVWALAGRFAVTSSVTSMTIFVESGNIAAGSTFSLFGVAA